MSEGKIWRDIRDKLSRGPLRLFRNECGNGVAVRHKHPHTRQAIISACIELAAKMGGSAGRIHFGLTTGSSDLIGLKTITITPEMVGCRIAQFVGVETKTATGSMREEQKRWLAFVNQAGGLAIVARDLAEAENKLIEVVDRWVDEAVDSSHTTTGRNP